MDEASVRDILPRATQLLARKVDAGDIKMAGKLDRRRDPRTAPEVKDAAPFGEELNEPIEVSASWCPVEFTTQLGIPVRNRAVSVFAYSLRLIHPPPVQPNLPLPH